MQNTILNSKLFWSTLILGLVVLLVMVSGFKINYINRTLNWRCNNETFIGRFIDSVFDWQKKTDQDTNAKEDEPGPDYEKPSLIEGGEDGKIWTPFKDGAK